MRLQHRRLVSWLFQCMLLVGAVSAVETEKDGSSSLRTYCKTTPNLHAEHNVNSVDSFGHASGARIPLATAAQRAILIGFGSIFAHAVNVQILQRVIYIEANHTAFSSKIMQQFLFQVGSIAYLPAVLCTTSSRKNLSDELQLTGTTPLGFGLMVLYFTFSKILSYLVWAWAATLAPDVLLKAIFESSIGLVYFLSMKFLDESVSIFKVAGVMIALIGTCMSQIAHQNEASESLITQADRSDSTTDLSFGSRICGFTLAMIAELVHILYHIWWKSRFGTPSLRLVCLWTAIMGLVNLVTMLPLLIFGEVVLVRWVASSRMFGLFIDVGKSAPTKEGIMIVVVCAVASFSSIGSLAVVAQYSPLLWAAVRMLTYPLAASLDFFISFQVPASGKCIGCALIVASFFVVSGGLQDFFQPAVDAEEVILEQPLRNSDMPKMFTPTPAQLVATLQGSANSPQGSQIELEKLPRDQTRI